MTMLPGLPRVGSIAAVCSKQKKTASNQLIATPLKPHHILYKSVR
jgi:hypothetical protein